MGSLDHFAQFKGSLGPLVPGPPAPWPLGPRALGRPLGPDNDADGRNLNTTRLYTTMLSIIYSNVIVVLILPFFMIYVYNVECDGLIVASRCDMLCVSCL